MMGSRSRFKSLYHSIYLLLASVGSNNIFSSPTAWLTWTPPFSRISVGGERSILRRVAASDIICCLIVTLSILEYHKSSCWVIVAEAERIGSTVGLEAKRTVGVGRRLAAFGKSTMSWSNLAFFVASADIDMMMVPTVLLTCEQGNTFTRE